MNIDTRTNQLGCQLVLKARPDDFHTVRREDEYKTAHLAFQAIDNPRGDRSIENR